MQWFGVRHVRVLPLGIFPCELALLFWLYFCHTYLSEPRESPGGNVELGGNVPIG